MADHNDIEAQAGMWNGDDEDERTLRRAALRGPDPVRTSSTFVSPTATDTHGERGNDTTEPRRYFKYWFSTAGEVAAKKETLDVDIVKLRDCRPGYPRLAAFLDSDDDLMIYRRFGYIQARLLLEKQNELQLLEACLKALDEDDDDEQPGCLKYADTRFDPPSGRVRLMRELQEKYTEYTQLIATAKELTSTARPPKSAYRIFRNFVSNTRPLCASDELWIRREEDLITLRPGRERAWLDDFLQYCLESANQRSLDWIFIAQRIREKTSGLIEQQTREAVDPLETDLIKGCPVYATRSRVEKLTTTIITVAIILLLGVPIYVLYHLTALQHQGPHTSVSCLGTLMVFTLAFSAVLAVFTTARRHEILSAAAAYCAVLVVFISNVTPSAPLS